MKWIWQRGSQHSAVSPATFSILHHLGILGEYFQGLFSPLLSTRLPKAARAAGGILTLLSPAFPAPPSSLISLCFTLRRSCSAPGTALTPEEPVHVYIWCNCSATHPALLTAALQSKATPCHKATGDSEANSDTASSAIIAISPVSRSDMGWPVTITRMFPLKIGERKKKRKQQQQQIRQIALQKKHNKFLQAKSVGSAMPLPRTITDTSKRTTDEVSKSMRTFFFFFWRKKPPPGKALFVHW